MELFRVRVPDGELAVASRPVGGAALAGELEELARSGVDVLVSMLVPKEAEAIGLEDEAELCRAAGMEFVSVPVVDHAVPDDTAAFKERARSIAERVRSGAHVAVHCRMGLGRSPLLVATVLVELGWDVDDAIVALRRARGFAVPETPEQRAWLREYGDAVAPNKLPGWLRPT